MHITKIELENIKSHVNSKFEFSRGTTAITGQNGAGKTSLLEAVAWTLFDLLDYKKDDFVRRGAKKGVARVTFESGLDEREYTVYRDTGTGYYVFDPRLKTRIADKKEEVCRFLWQHLGVDPGTDLDSLFRRAIGVPQGTFTAIFLESPAERKKAFDKLLKVDEYREGADKLRDTAKFIENKTIEVREKIAKAAGELTQHEHVSQQHKEFSEIAVKLGEDLIAITAEIEKRQSEVRVFDEKESDFLKLKTRVDQHTSEAAKSEIILQQKEAAVEQAKQAAESVEKAQTGHEKHLAALARLAELDRERTTRDKLTAEAAKVETALVKVNADRKRAQENFETAQKAHHQIEALRPLKIEQDGLDKELHKLRAEFTKANGALERTKKLEEDVARMRETYAANHKQIQEAELRSNGTGDVEGLQTLDSDLVKRLASLQAHLERDEKFQQEIRDGLCPILSQKCLNLKEGETLETFVSSQFSELRSEISVLETEQKMVAVRLKASREAEKVAATLATLTVRQDEIKAEGERLKQEIAALKEPSEKISELDNRISTIEERLKELDNPGARLPIFEAEAAREIEIRQEITQIESNIERLESDRKILVEQLESYKELDVQWTEFSVARDFSSEAHRTFLANETMAASLSAYRNDLETAKRSLAEIKTELQKAQESLDVASRDYDREKHLTAKAQLIEIGNRHVETKTRLDAAEHRKRQLADELKRLEEVRSAMQAEYLERDKLEKSAELTTFIRDTLKEAAPRVARNYVHRVSLEANQMFREVSGSAEQTLKWAEDYGILLEEDGHDRPFINLSGGEQMAAALSVRLALLKQLSDIRIAFFDEPTTNMDAARRENLAMQISQIKHFDQLFVISHDDTFEGYVDNHLSVEKDRIAE
jgi:ATPase involved in DNA repair